jgi:hypothetical protein
MYDIVYRGAACMILTLRYLDTAYHDHMRSILGHNRAQHVRIVNMHKLASVEPPSDRANRSLQKYMNQVESKYVHSEVQSLLRNVIIARVLVCTISTSFLFRALSSACKKSLLVV